jgi:signal transduction histidine kinase
MIGRLPIRIRLTLAFTLVMALVLAATGLFLYLRLGSGLAGALDQSLRARAVDVAALAKQSDSGLRAAGQLPGRDIGFAQLVGANGKVIDATPGLPAHPLVPASGLAAARRGPRFFDLTIGPEHLRVLARPVTAQGGRLVVIVGASLEPRTEALTDLRRQLLSGGPVALLLASLAGYLLAAAALRPVERMGERAATISAASPGRRLPVPRANDEIARLGTRLNEMLARLEAALGRERSLVSNTSHELRTPLALMKTEIELALAEPPSVPGLAAALRSAGEETDRLSQLTDDLLLLARADTGALPLRRTDVHVHELLETIVTRFRRRAEDAGRRIEVTAPDDLVLLGDRRLLEQALSNLVENALRHGAGAVGLDAREHDGSVTIRVTDEGEGLPPEFAGRAFERFSRAEQSRGTPGAGLGLSIVATIAQAHGGQAAPSSNPAGIALTLPAGHPGGRAGERQADRQRV